MTTVRLVLTRLRAKANPKNVEGMANYGMTAKGRLGVSVPEMRRIAKEVGKNHRLALALWKTGLAEAKILAAMIDDPGQLTEEQMEAWVRDIDSWDICDQVCMNLFEKSPLAWKKIHEWSHTEEEFVKRAAFSLIACLAWHDKAAKDGLFISMLPIIRREAIDERNFVKKAVNWALRNIGKRNSNLRMAALKTAKEIQCLDSKAARWIGSDAIKELESEALARRQKR